MIDFVSFLIFSSIELTGMTLLFFQVFKKIKPHPILIGLGWGLFAGGLGIKLILYGIEIAKGNL